jgi:hypothetical protein
VAGTGTRIRIVQQGGFAGTIEQVDVDSATLEPSAASQVEAAHAELAGLAQAVATAEPEIGADLPHYVVEIERGGTAQRFEIPETAGRDQAFAGPTIGAIIERLQLLSRG